MGGATPKVIQEATESEPPILPMAAHFAWSYFLRLSQTRQSGGFGGFSAISYQEMLAFFTLEQTFPEPYELELIRVWDRMMIEHYNKKQEDKPSTKK
jgi:hypothetical protein